MPRFPKIALCLLSLACIASRALAYDSTATFHKVDIFDVSNSSDTPQLAASIPLDFPYVARVPIANTLPNRFEIRLPITQVDSGKPPSTNILSLYLPATYEVYWNDIQVGSSGTLSADGSEISPGNSYRSFALPQFSDDAPSPLIRIRGTHSHTGSTKHAFIITVDSLESSLAASRYTGITYTLFIGFALFGVYLLSFFAINRNQPQYLFLGLSCLLFAVYAVNKLFYYQLNVPYPQLDTIGFIASAAHFALSLTAPAALLFLFGYRKPVAFAFLILPYLAASLFPQNGIVAATAYACLALSCFAAFQKRPHALHAVAITAFLVANYQIPFLLYNQAIGFGALMLYLLVSIINLLTRESQKRSQAQLRNARLQVELLKSKIQPHFVLNSLTSAIEWIETNPKQGAKLIQELAKEFETLSAIADQTTIPLATEIDSCRTYLRIMEFRKKASYQLELENIDLQETLPPAILRNLIENAISHNAYGQLPVTFHFSCETTSSARTYTFRCPLTETPEPSIPPADGTGIQYIKARLAETYPVWTFTHGPQANTWQTQFQIPLS